MTTGPWQIDRTEKYYKHCIRMNGVIIALLTENEENDRVLAAAPELLEELHYALMTTYQYEQTLLSLGRNDAANIYTDRYRKIKSLIAKVEGK